jgi:glycosyltransferase involved in cell wall biosynthesis
MSRIPPARRIVFWQPIASPHQEAFLEAVAARFSGEVILGYEDWLPASRRQQGWPACRFERVTAVDISDPQNWARLAGYSTATDVHVFTGFFSHPLVWRGFFQLQRSAARLAIFSEAPEQPWWNGWIKRLRGRALATRWQNRFFCVLACGEMGCRFFTQSGFSPHKVLPFGYFLADQSPPLESQGQRAPPSRAPAQGSAHQPPLEQTTSGRVRFIYAGQFVPRKGIDILMRAIATIGSGEWHLDAYGDGPLRTSLETLLEQPRMRERIRLHGVVPNHDLPPLLARADWTLLPSRFDGWGLLVNESLAVGTPVICTDRCGANCLVQDDQMGRVVQAGSVASLAAALESAIGGGPVQTVRRTQLAATAASFSASRAAEFFLATVAGGPDATRVRMQQWLL